MPKNHTFQLRHGRLDPKLYQMVINLAEAYHVSLDTALSILISRMFGIYLTTLNLKEENNDNPSHASGNPPAAISKPDSNFFDS